MWLYKHIYLYHISIAAYGDRYLVFRLSTKCCAVSSSNTLSINQPVGIYYLMRKYFFYKINIKKYSFGHAHEKYLYYPHFSGHSGCRFLARAFLSHLVLTPYEKFDLQNLKN
jgi:hypothetical protein